jgi:hypothetical protein
MAAVPYRHVNLSAQADAQRLKVLKPALKKGDTEGVTTLAGEIGDDLRATGNAGLAADAPEAVEAAKALEQIVRAIADNRRALLPFRERFPALARVVKDPWSTERVDPMVGAFVSTMPKKRKASVRVDPDLRHSIDTDGPLGHCSFVDGQILFRRGRQNTARVDGPETKLMVLAELVGDRTRLMPAELLALEVPRSVDDFHSGVENAQAEVEQLLADGCALVEAAERLVCALYGVPAELADEVVTHAAERAKARAATVD